MSTNRYDRFTYSDPESSDDYSSSDSDDEPKQQPLHIPAQKQNNVFSTETSPTQKPLIPSISEPPKTSPVKPVDKPLHYSKRDSSGSLNGAINSPIIRSASGGIASHSRTVSLSSEKADRLIQKIDSRLGSIRNTENADAAGSIDELSQSLDMLALEISHRDGDDNDSDNLSANIIDDYSREASSSEEDQIRNKSKPIVGDWRIDSYSEDEDSKLHLRTDTDGLHISQEPSSSVSAATPTEGLKLGGQNSRRVSQILESKTPLTTQVLVSGPKTDERPMSWLPNSDSDSDSDDEDADLSRAWGARPEQHSIDSTNSNPKSISFSTPRSKVPEPSTLKSPEVANNKESDDDDGLGWRSMPTESPNATIDTPSVKARTIDVIPETPKEVPESKIVTGSPSSPIDMPIWKATTTDYDETDNNNNNNTALSPSPDVLYNKDPLISPDQNRRASWHSKGESYDADDVLTSWDAGSSDKDSTSKKQQQNSLLKTPNVGSPDSTPKKQYQDPLLETPSIASPSWKGDRGEDVSPNSWRINDSAVESDNDWLTEAQKYIEIATSEPVDQEERTGLSTAAATAPAPPIAATIPTKTTTQDADEEDGDEDKHDWRNETTEEDYEQYYHPKPKKKSITDAGSINTFLDDTETESDDDGGWKAYASDEDDEENDEESDANSWDKDDDNYSFVPHDDDRSIIKGGNSSTGSLSTGNFSAVQHEDDASSDIFNHSKDMRDQFVNSNRAFSINSTATGPSGSIPTSTTTEKDYSVDPVSEAQTLSSSKYSSQPSHTAGSHTSPSQDFPATYNAPRHLDSLPENDELNTSIITDTTANDSSFIDTSNVSNIPEPQARKVSQSSASTEVINVKLDLSKMPVVDINKILSLPTSEKRIERLRSAREELLHYDTNLAAFLKQAMRSHATLADDIQLGPNAANAFRNAPTSSSGPHLTISSLTNNLTNNLTSNLPTPSFNRKPSTTRKKSTKLGNLLKSKLHF